MIGIIFAMYSEAKDFLNNNKLIQEIKYSKDFYYNDDIVVAISGVGKVNASFTTTILIKEFNVDKIINIGIAGGNSHMNVGDILLIDKIYYHDFDLTAFGYDLGEIPGIAKYFKASDLKIELKKGNVASGDRFITGISPLNNIDCFDMETAAIAHVCFLCKIEIFSIKIISDVIGKSKINDYEIFEKKASIIINQVVKDVLRCLN